MTLTPIKAIVALSLALALTVGVEQHRVTAARDHLAAAALATTNAAAARDSTRNVAATNEKIAALLGDSLQLVEQQVVQTAQRADGLDKALGGERRARYSLGMVIDSLQQIASAAVAVEPDSSSHADAIRRAFFDVRQPPFTVAARVDIPTPPDSAHLAMRIAIDPIPMTARLTCSATNGEGIRTASIEASSPPWATVRFGQVEQSPDFCASPTLHPPAAHRLLEVKKLVIGVGRVVRPNGVGSWGWFVGSGVALWN